MSELSRIKNSVFGRKQTGDNWLEYDGGTDIVTFDARKVIVNGKDQDVINTEISGTGIIEWTLPGAEHVSGDQVRLYPGKAKFYDGAEVSWDTTIVTDDLITTSTLTFFAIDRDGAWHTFDGELVGEDRREFVTYAGAVHFNKTAINAVTFVPTLAVNITNLATDIADAIALVHMDGVVYTNYDTTTSQLKHTEGHIFTNASRNVANSNTSYNVFDATAEDPIPFLLTAYHDGSDGVIGVVTGPNMDTTSYDDYDGTPAEMLDDHWLTSRIFYEPATRLNIVALGQQQHKGRLSALSNINAEPFVDLPVSEGWMLRGYATYQKGAVGDDIIFTEANKHGELAKKNLSLATPSGFAAEPTYESFPFTSRGVNAGTYYMGGFNQFSDTDANLSQASTTVSFGSANASYAAHPYIVSGGPGTVDTGVVGLRANFTSIDDNGTRTTSDSEVILSDITDATAAALNKFTEVVKKALGIIEFELYVVSGSPTTYSFDFNYGIVKYNDLGNRDFMITDYEITGYGDGNDALFNAELIHHPTSGFTYAATGFSPYDTPIVSLADDHAADRQVYANQYFAHKRGGDSINRYIQGSVSSGFLTRITQSVNGAVQITAARVGMVF